MKIETATPALAQFMARVISIEMAERLAADRVDLSNPDAVIVALGRHGFGSGSIASCMDRAIQIAVESRPGAVQCRLRRGLI